MQIGPNRFKYPINRKKITNKFVFDFVYLTSSRRAFALKRSHRLQVRPGLDVTIKIHPCSKFCDSFRFRSIYIHKGRH